ncbi:MAG: ParA family protein [Candidatus Latescibacteria bacterium]|nr:ParA family protein [Candidatus Latescibacterota bacterium]
MSDSGMDATTKKPGSEPDIPASEPKTKGGNNGQNLRTIEISLPRESDDLKFTIDVGAADSSCRLIAFLSPKGGSGKTVLGTNLGKILQLCGYNILLLDADFTTKSLTNLIFPGRKVIAEDRTSYYKGLLGIDGFEMDKWLQGIRDDTHILPIHTAPNGKRIDILLSYYTKEQQSSISSSIFLRESGSHNLGSVVERFSMLLSAIKSLKRYDYIILDCASAFDDIGLAASILSPFVVVVSEADDISFEAMDDSLRYTISFATSDMMNGEYRIKQPFIALNKDPNLRPGEKTSRRAAFHCKYIPDIHKSFGKKSFLVPDVIEDVEFEYQLYRLWRRIAEWSTNPEETFTEVAYQRVLQLEKMRNLQIERYWNADLQYRKRNVMFGLSVLLTVSCWVGIFGYLQPSFSAITTACSGLGLFLSSVLLYGVWEHFEKGIRALKHELYIDVWETSEDHRQFVHGLGNLVKARENGGRPEEEARPARPPKEREQPKPRVESVPAS